mgnify:FL=1
MAVLHRALRSLLARRVGQRRPKRDPHNRFDWSLAPRIQGSWFSHEVMSVFTDLSSHGCVAEPIYGVLGFASLAQLHPTPPFRLVLIPSFISPATMTYLSSILILLAGSLLVSASPIPDANPEPVPALNNAERVMRGLALMSPKKLFDASKRASEAYVLACGAPWLTTTCSTAAERSTVSPSAFFKTYRCGHDQTPVCCYKGVEPSDDTCFNAFSGTGGAATTAPFTW